LACFRTSQVVRTIAGLVAMCSYLEEGTEGIPVGLHCPQQRESPALCMDQATGAAAARIIESTKQYQAAHPRKPRKRRWVRN